MGSQAERIQYYIQLGYNMSHKYKFKCCGNNIRVGPQDSSVGKALAKPCDLSSIPAIHVVGKRTNS